MSQRRWVVVGVVAMGALLLGGCGADTTASATGAGDAPDASAGAQPAGTQAGDVAVAAVDNVFKADTITVTAGSKVTWTNAGRNDHNIKPVDAGQFGVDTSSFKPGSTYTATFSTPGTYHYYCSIHGTRDRGMIGTVEVVS